MIGCRDLRVHAGRRELLHVPELDVPAGSVLAVLGPNGAGKTTLLRALGLLGPHRITGDVLLDKPSPPVRTCGSPPRPSCSDRSCAGARSPPTSPLACASAEHRERRPANAQPPGSTGSVLRTSPTGTPARSPAARPSAPAPWSSPSDPGCCCSTSRSPGSTPPPGAI